MIQLFLSKPVWASETDVVGTSDPRLSLIDELEKSLWTLIISEGRSEARLWLCDTISSFKSITPKQQRVIFIKLLKSNRDLAAQVLQMIFERRPNKLGMILARKSHVLEKFFRGHPKRILQWFSNFSFGGDTEHRKGAKALSQFAFINRDNCWEELEWKGHHGQSPAVVATKPHYFLDLDVQRTVENFLDYVPDFWLSEEFSETLKDGEILSMDIKFFLDFFVKLMYKDHSDEVWEVVSDFLMDESFSCLCQRLLIVLDEQELSVLLEIMQDIFSRRDNYDAGNSSYCLEILLSECCGRISMDQVLLLNAVFNKRRQIKRLLQNHDSEEEKMKIKDLRFQIYNASVEAKSLLSTSKECRRLKKTEILKWFSLFSWILLCKMSEECHTLKLWESLFFTNGISFRKTDEHHILPHIGTSDLSDSEMNDSSETRTKKKRKRKARRKRKKDLDYEDFDDELLEIDDSRLQPLAGSWFLSIDSYSTSWSVVDLPEYLSNHCLSVWMKQI
ncbi:hypothetical protein V2J09_013104 [Rumex salicifolius]